jgi:uncharacterized protein
MITVRADDVVAQPWKNGGGVTRALASDGAHWRWRISLADINRDGPFSIYPGVERWFAVVDGGGVELTLAGASKTLRPRDPPVSFDGALAPACRLLAGPTRDLNLMLRGVAGVMQRAAQATPWAEDWTQRGHFDIATRTLRWQLPPGPLAAPGDGYWIGINA